MRNVNKAHGFFVAALVLIVSLVAANGFAEDAHSTAVQGKKKQLIYAVMMDASSNAGQLKALYEKAVKTVSAHSDFDLIYKGVNNEKEFMEGIRTGKFDFVYSWRHDTMLTAIEKYDYTPFLSYSAFGVKSESQCLFVKKDSPAKDLNDLKGKSALIIDDYYSYVSIRKILGARPEDFFGVLKANPKFFSFFYSLSLGEEDVIQATPETVEFYRMNNPGPVKNIKKIVCGIETPMLYVLRSPKTLDSEARKVVEMMVGAPKDEEYKEYRPLMRTSKLKFIPVTIKDFKPLFDLMAEARKKGWEKDYRKWLNMQQSD